MIDVPYWQPAEARPQIWRTVLGFVLVMAFWFAATNAVVIGASRWFDLPIWEIVQGESFVATGIVFSTFAAFHLGLALMLPVLHRRSYFSLFGPMRRLDWRHFFRGVLAVLAIFALLSALTVLEPLFLPRGSNPPVVEALPVERWALGLGPALGFIFVQSLGEELVFRGYLLQQLRARFRSPLIWGVLPALIFGGLHFSPDTYGMVNALVYVLNAAVAGTLAAFITLRTGNLGASAGLHFGNNITMVLVGATGSPSGFSLFLTEMDPQSFYTAYSILTQSAVLIIGFLIWWRWMAQHRRIANDAGAA